MKSLKVRVCQLSKLLNYKEIIVNNKCICCGLDNISKDDIGINKKLIYENIENFYCIDCLAEYLEADKEDILDKIYEFKEQGCTMFL